MDDSSVDYTSILDQEDMVRRWSEDVVDLELRDSVRLNKLYRKVASEIVNGVIDMENELDGLNFFQVDRLLKCKTSSLSDQKISYWPNHHQLHFYRVSQNKPKGLKVAKEVQRSIGSMVNWHKS